MKNYFLLFLIICSTSLTAQDKSLEFLSTEFDFGLIKEEQGPVEHSFQFINLTEDSIMIKDVKSSCGCTTAGWSQEAVLPADTGFVNVLYDPLNRPGKFNKSITVTTTNTNPSAYALQIKGLVLPKPRSIAEEFPNQVGSLRMKNHSFHLQKITTKEPVDKSFIWINDSQQKIIFSDSVVAPEFIKVDLQPDTLMPQESGKIIIHYDPIAKNDFGYVTDQITLFTNDSLQPVKNMKVVASIIEYFPPMSKKELKKAPQIEFLEKSHDFGHVNKGKEVVSAFRFANTGKSDLSIRKVETNCQCVSLDSIPAAVAPGEEFTLNAHFDTSGRYGTQQKIITVFSNDPLKPINVLTIKGRIEME